MQWRRRNCASSQNIFVCLFVTIGWMGGGGFHTFYRTKYICKKLWITFHPSTFGGALDAKRQHRFHQKVRPMLDAVVNFAIRSATVLNAARKHRKEHS
jgi:hypothetical protein